MKFAASVSFFILALFVDASRLLVIPGVDSGPLMFVALVCGYALRTGPLSGGVWGFAGGLAMGLLYADNTIGARALGGLLAGCIPVAVRRFLFWRRWTGQIALGMIASLLFEVTLLQVAWLRGELAGFHYTIPLRVVLSAVLTGVACPLLMRLVERAERIH